MAPVAPSAAVGSVAESPSAIAPAHPPMPEYTATYCLPSGPHEGHRIADDPRTRLELPQYRTSVGVHGVEPSVHCPVEHEVAPRHDRSAPYWESLWDAPHLLAGGRRSTR